MSGALRKRYRNKFIMMDLAAGVVVGLAGLAWYSDYCRSYFHGAPEFCFAPRHGESDARRETAQLSDLVRFYELMHGRLPPSLPALTQAEGTMPPITSGISFDPWRRPYRYQALGLDHFLVWSTGRDGESFTADDIVVEWARSQE